jgi:hypothetical protein
MILLIGFAQSAAAQIFPDTVYAWHKTDERVLPPEEWRSAMGEHADVFEAFGVSEVRLVRYTRGNKTARVEIAALPSRERAFGLFRAMTGAGISYGIIGDAFSYERSVARVNTGPYYFHVMAEEKRATQPPDEALVVRTRRVLFTRADCFGSDFPLPADERVLGSERYLVPDASVWQALRSRVANGLLPVLSTHAAYAAEYEKSHLKVRRTLLLFPFRQKDAAAAFAAELVQQLESRMYSRSEACAIPAFVSGGVQHVIAADATRVFLIITDAGDGGCCEWARALLRP